MGNHTNIPLKDIAKIHFSGPCRNRSCTCTSWQNSKRTGMDYPSTIDLRGVRTWGSSAWNLDHFGTKGQHRPSASGKYINPYKEDWIFTHIHERTWDWLIAKVKNTKLVTWEHHPLSQIIGVYIHQHRTWDFTFAPGGEVEHISLTIQGLHPWQGAASMSSFPW